MSRSDPIVNLLAAYHDLNVPVVDELSEEPSPLEFLRYVAQNRPFVVRRAAADWTAVRKWNADYLRQMLDGKDVCVAVTPKGNADAIVQQLDGRLVFVQPFETPRRFFEFLEFVQLDSTLHGQKLEERNVQYAQTQNDNLRNEYETLFADVPPEIAFARVALDRGADAVNFWLGNHRSITSLHKDNYENIYVQVRGEKHFVLLPPVSMPCVNEKNVMQGRYAPSISTGDDSVPSLHEQKLKIDIDDTVDSIPVPTWDPDQPEQRTSAYSHLAQPLRVTLEEGDMLYLPAMWFHKVSQSVGDEGFALAVNYWYDMEFSGSFWASNSFIRDVVEAEKTKVEYPELTTGQPSNR